MSRAFVKEPEAKEPRCPSAAGGCGGLGISVALATVRANFAGIEFPEFHGDIFYCPDVACPIAYFDGFGPRVDRSQLQRRAWPKDPDGPVCSCFGVTAEQIEEYSDSGNKAAMRQILERAASSAARCSVMAPDGRNCAVEVRRIFMRALDPGGPSFSG